MRFRALIVAAVAAAVVTFTLVVVRRATAPSGALADPRYAEAGLGLSAPDRPQIPAHPDDESATREPLDSPPVPSTGRAAVQLSGRVVLTDGSPGARMSLVAVAAGAPRQEGFSIRSRAQSNLVLGAGWSDELGKFAMTLEAAEVPARFELRHVNFQELRQSPTQYPWRSNDSIVHEVPGGRLRIRVLEPSGMEATDTTVTARFSEDPASESSSSRTREGGLGGDGVAEFLFAEPSLVEVVATRRRDGATARTSGFWVDPRTPTGEHTLVLEPPSDTGSIRILVADQRGVPIIDYAVTVAAVDGSFGPRFVDSREVGSAGLLEGVPKGRVEVTLVKRFRFPPSLYATEAAPYRVVDVLPGETAELRLTATARARLALEVGSEHSSRHLAVRYRYEDDDPDQWKVHSHYWVFFESGTARDSSWTEEPGVYYTEPLREGALQVEVFDARTDEVVWSGPIVLVPGSISTIDLAD